MIWLRLDHVGEIAARIVYGTSKYFAVEFFDATASAMPSYRKVFSVGMIATPGCPRPRGFRRAPCSDTALDGYR